MRARIGPATTLDTTVLLYVQKAKHNIWGGVRHGLVSGWKALRSTNMPVNVKRVLVIRVNIRACITLHFRIYWCLFLERRVSSFGPNGDF